MLLSSGMILGEFLKTQLHIWKTGLMVVPTLQGHCKNELMYLKNSEQCQACYKFPWMVAIMTGMVQLTFEMRKIAKSFVQIYQFRR